MVISAERHATDTIAVLDKARAENHRRKRVLGFFLADVATGIHLPVDEQVFRASGSGLGYFPTPPVPRKMVQSTPWASSSALFARRCIVRLGVPFS